MKKSFIIALIAVFPLMFSCSKEVSVEATEVETPEIQVAPWIPVEYKEVEALPGNHILTAGFGDDTKSHLVMNGTGTHADILFDSGDSFKMMGYTTDYYQTANYSTSQTGAKVDFSTGTTIDYTENGLHCVYPASAFQGLTFIVSEEYIRVGIPSAQTAVANGVDPKASLSYAQAASQSADLHFKNAVSLIKFRLSGAVISQVKSISFKSVSKIAGDFLLSLASSNPAFASGTYDGLNNSREVVLSGDDFAEGVDYYIALAPCNLDGFTMTFSNSDGTKKVKKVFNGSLLLNRSTITDFGTIALGDSFPAAEPALTPYMSATAGASKAVTICVIPDGFRESELDDYELQAKSGIDALFNTEPYKTYKNYFNVWILKKASNESGANKTDGSGNITEAHDCYFQSKWGGANYSDMSANENRVYSFVEDNCPDLLNGSHTISEVPILIIINDSRYGGIAHSSGSGKTYCMVPITSGTLSWSYPDTEAASVDATPSNTRAVSSEEKETYGLKNSGTWRNTLVHEFGGHSFGRLLDEYWYSSYYGSGGEISSHNWTVPFGLNISGTRTNEDTPWSALLTAANKDKMTATGKTTQYSRIGVFQGGQVSMFNRWRSERISCMIDNRFYFSTWQRWLIVNRIMTLAGAAAVDFDTFLAHDVPEDPVRDSGTPVMLPDGLVNSIPPVPVPMLPPPVFHEDW